MANRIVERVADFLGRYPPFNELTEKDLLRLSEGVDILYREKYRFIFREEDPTHAFFYVVHSGAVQLRRSGTGEIVDICDEGDIFGLRPLMAGETYKLEARTQEDCILYALPIADFRPLVTSYEEVGNFLIESFASNTRNPYARQHGGTLVGTGFGSSEATVPGDIPDLLPLRPRKKVVSCSPDTPAMEIAHLMSAEKVGSVVVIHQALPLGIITDRDLRTRVVSGQYPISAPATDIMSYPIITYPGRLTLTQAQLAMMQHGIGHLCLTEDGTPHSPVVGILTKHDLLLAIGQNPEVLMQAIKRSSRLKDIRAARNRVTGLLHRYLRHQVPMALTMKLVREINDACIKQVIVLALKKVPPPPVPFAWLALGSQGRGEQMLLTDQDNALIFQDVTEAELPEVQAYFLDLARRITKGLLKIGFPYCPAEMMASEPDWCMSLSRWKQRITGWMKHPGDEEVLLSSIFFDFNFTYGAEALVRELTSFIFQRTEQHPAFLKFLARGALQNPSPSGFFRQFLVEQDGAHKDAFDLKQRVLLPFTDAARVLILSHRVPNINNTSERFEKLAELEPANRELFLSCSYAAKALLKFRVRQGLLHGDSGRYIRLEELSKEEKMKLKRSFKVLKNLQELLELRFQLKNIA